MVSITRSTAKKVAVSVAIVLTGTGVASTSLVACSSDRSGVGDAGVQQKHYKDYVSGGRPGQLDKPASIIKMPDGYHNVAMVCNGTDGVYSTTGNMAWVTPKDPMCGG